MPSSPHPRLALTVMCAGMFLVLLDVTAVNVAAPSIEASLNTGVGGLQWVIDGYAIALASLLLSGGVLADALGRRRAVSVGFATFGVASVGCGLAPSTEILVAARVLQGVGAAALLPASLAVIAATFPGRAEQARALGLWAGVSSLALPAGPLLGGLLVSRAGWHWVFLANVPVVAAALIGVLVVIEPDAERRSGRFDLPGALLAAVVLAATVDAMIDANLSWSTGAAALTAALAGGGLVIRQRHATAPLLPRSLLARRSILGANAVAMTMNLTSNGLLFLLTLYLQTVQRHSAVETGLLLLPLFAPLALLSPSAGRLAARHGSRLPIVTGALLAGAGQLGLLTTSDRSSYPVLLPALLASGTGIALVTAPVVASAVRGVPPRLLGIASAINTTARQAGTALGVAIYGTLAGPPTEAAAFVSGLHVAVCVGALLWATAIVLTFGSLRPAACPVP